MQPLRKTDAVFSVIDLQSAMDRDQLALDYQPQFDLHTGDMVGAEALVRWVHPDHGRLMPSQFVPTAERNGSIMQIGDWVLRRACMDHHAAELTGDRTLVLSVNLSTRQIYDRRLVETVASTLRHARLAPEHLRLELRENVLANDDALVLANLRELRAMGVSIAADDFGIGLSSLTGLTRFPVDTVKLDAELVANMFVDPKSLQLTRAISHLAVEVGLTVMADGVQSPSHVEVLREAGCQIGQGFSLGPPAGLEKLISALAAKPGSAQPLRTTH